MISYDQDPAIVNNIQNSTFIDDESNIDISHRSMCSNVNYLGFDIVFDSFDSMHLRHNDKDIILLNDIVVSFVKKSVGYIGNITAPCVCVDTNISDEDAKKMINFYNNTFSTRDYPYTVSSLFGTLKNHIKYRIADIEKNIIQLSAEYYIGESKNEQEDLVSDAINNIRYYYSNKNTFASGVSVINFYTDKTFKNPFIDKNFLNEINNTDVNDLLKPILTIIERVYKYKSFKDIERGIIKPNGSRIENAIYIMYFLLTLEIEFVFRNIRDSIDVFTDYYEGYLDQNKPVFIPSVYESLYKDSEFLGDVTKSFEDAGIGEDGKASAIKVDANYKKKSEELYKIYLSTVKLSAYNVKRFFNSMFFKKYYGRIPSLYDRYGNDAKLAENTLNGDPTKILKESGVKYIQDMTKDAIDLFNEIISLSTKVANAQDYRNKLSIVKGYCKRFPISDDTQISIIDDCIRKETIHRIATSIFRDINIYGFTVEGVVENGKFPPANHIVVSLFTENPHEKPSEHSVTDIFSSADNIIIYAKPDLGNFFNDIYKKVSNNIMQGLNVKGIDKVSGLLEKSSNDYKHNIKAQIKSGNIEKDKNLKTDEKAIKMINKGLEQSIEIVWHQKRRCMQCISVMLDMTQRIILLAKKAVVAMLAVEKQNKDERHNTGFKSETVGKTHAGTAKKTQANLMDSGAGEDEVNKYAKNDKNKYKKV